MGKTVRNSRGKTMKPNFFVFCEGKTEINYVKFLRSVFRVPIQVIAKKSESNISVDFIERSKRGYVLTQYDETFLMFDLDVEGMLEHLQKISKATLLVSNPCIELWFLLHFQGIDNEITSNGCLRMLKAHSPQYEKGALTELEKRILVENMAKAIERAKKLEDFKNPSSLVYRLIEAMERV